MDAQNYKNVCPKFLIFVKFWKCAKKNIMESANLFVVIVYIVHKQDAHN